MVGGARGGARCRLQRTNITPWFHQQLARRAQLKLPLSVAPEWDPDSFPTAKHRRGSICQSNRLGQAAEQEGDDGAGIAPPTQSLPAGRKEKLGVCVSDNRQPETILKTLHQMLLSLRNLLNLRNSCSPRRGSEEGDGVSPTTRCQGRRGRSLLIR